MFTPIFRWLLATLSFAYGALLVYRSNYLGFVFIGAAAFQVYGYFKYGTVWLAFRAVARGRMDEGARLLSEVKRPEALQAQHRAYYELASGFICAARRQNEQAEQHLRFATSGALRTENDRALAETVLAQLLIARGELVEATAVLDRATTRACRPAVAERIRALRAELPAAS